MKVYTASSQEGRRGSALIILMIIILLVSIGGAAMVGFAKQQAYSMNTVRDYLAAQAYAEAGASEAYGIIKANFAARNDPTKFPARTFGDGGYDADVQPVGDNMAVITCQGTRGTATAEVKLDIVNKGIAAGGSVPPTSPWAYGVFVNGYLDHNGTGTQTGNTHVNGYLVHSGGGNMEWGTAAQNILVAVCGVDGKKGIGADFNGGGTIHGTLKAVKVDGNPTVSPGGIVLGPVATIPMPNISAKLTEYYNIALANGQVFNAAPASGNIGVIPGGVRWYNCDGGIDISGGVNYEGSVICTGPITFRGGVNQKRVGNLPAIVSRNGSITVKGAHTVEGLVYAAGDVEWNGAGTIDGSIVVGGNLQFNGSYGNLAYTYSEPGSAGGGWGSSSDNVGVSAWQK